MKMFFLRELYYRYFASTEEQNRQDCELMVKTLKTALHRGLETKGHHTVTEVPTYKMYNPQNIDIRRCEDFHFYQDSLGEIDVKLGLYWHPKDVLDYIVYSALRKELSIYSYFIKK